jgi:DNA-binding NtrC family response regulator
MLGSHVHDPSWVIGSAAVLIEEISRLELPWQERLAAWLEDTLEGPRILATSSTPLWTLVRQGTFCAALYYRLQPGRIALPPLRERLSDLAVLSSWFLGEIRPGVSFRLKPSALRVLEDYPWPGNIRELRNTLEWACQAAGAKLGIEAEDLPAELRHPPNLPAHTESLPGFLRTWLDDRLSQSPNLPYRELHDELEAARLENLLRRHQNKPSRLASERGLNRSTLRRRLQDLGIDTRDL